MHTHQRTQVSAGVGKPSMDLECASGWHGQQPVSGTADPGVVKQDKSSRGSVDTTKTRSDPQGQNVQGREANRRRQRQTNQHHGFVPTPPCFDQDVSYWICSILHSAQQCNCRSVKPGVESSKSTIGFATCGIRGCWNVTWGVPDLTWGPLIPDMARGPDRPPSPLPPSWVGRHHGPVRVTAEGLPCDIGCSLMPGIASVQSDMWSRKSDVRPVLRQGL